MSLGAGVLRRKRNQVREARDEVSANGCDGRGPKHNSRSIFIGAQTNNVRWSVYLSDYGISFSSPAIGEDGTIYIGAHDVVNPLKSYLLALNPADGTVKWQVETESTVDAAPSIGADGLVYVGDVNYNFKAYSPIDGGIRDRRLGAVLRRHRRGRHGLCRKLGRLSLRLRELEKRARQKGFEPSTFGSGGQRSIR